MSTGSPYGDYGGSLQGYGHPTPPPQQVPQPNPAPWPLAPSGPPVPPMPYGGYGPAPRYGSPYGYPGPPVAAPRPLPPRTDRPAVLATASTLAVTGSMLFVCALGFLWIVALAYQSSYPPSAGEEAAIYHIAERFDLRLRQGLVLPLFGFPLAAVVTGLMLPMRRAWTRIAFTITGVLAVGWSAWWLRDHLGWWVPALVYVGLSTAIAWTPAATRWYRAATTGSSPRVSLTDVSPPAFTPPEGR